MLISILQKTNRLDKKQDPIICWLQDTHLISKDKHILKVKE
jgi:hypothetical protein